MSEPTRLMLAAKAESMKFSLPMLASYKIDGIRCVVVGGVALSRKWLPLPNGHIQAWAKKYRRELEGLDGEIVVGAASAPDVFNATQSGVMSVDGAPDFQFYVFDSLQVEDLPYAKRYQNVLNRVAECKAPRVKAVRHWLIKTNVQLDALESKALDCGYEGLMLRSLGGKYKHGRATPMEGTFFKVKRFVDEEAEIISVEEMNHNENEATVNAFGRTKRSSAKEGKVKAGVLGKLRCKLLRNGMRFGVGSGFSAAEREKLWAERDTLPGKVVRVKYFPSNDPKLAPRFPVFAGFRDRRDM